jgi:hypothetical protein
MWFRVLLSIEFFLKICEIPDSIVTYFLKYTSSALIFPDLDQYSTEVGHLLAIHLKESCF